MKDPGKSPCVFGITLNKIAIEVKVFRITTEPFFRGTILIDPVIGTSIQASANIVYGNNSDNNICRQFVFASYDVPGQQHACINAIGFAGMNAIIDEDDSFIFLSNAFKIVITIVGHDYEI